MNYKPTKHPSVMEKMVKSEDEMNEQQFIEYIFELKHYKIDVHHGSSEYSINLDKEIDYEDFFEITIALQRKDIFFYGASDKKHWYLCSKAIMEDSSRFGKL